MDLGKVPPQDIEAEQAVIGSMLTDQDAVSSAIETLKPEDFYREDNKIIYEAILNIYNRAEPIDIITLKAELSSMNKLEAVGGLEYIAVLPDKVPTTANVDRYIKIVEEKAMLRNLIKTANEILNMGYEPTEEPERVMDLAEKKIFDVMQKKSQKGYTPIKDVLVESFAKLEELYNQKQHVTGVPTGFIDLDRMTAGLHGSEFILIAARPAMGKSAFALNIGAYAATRANIPVAIFSLEMAKDQVANRILCSEALVDSNAVRTGELTDEDLSKLAETSGELSQAQIFIDDTAGISVMEIRAKCRKLKLEKNIGLVIIDYLQLVQGSGKTSSREQEIAEISRSLKILAKEIGAEEDYVAAYLLNDNYVSSVDPCKNSVVKTWEAMIKMGFIDQADADKINIEDHINTELYKEALDECVAEYHDEDPDFYDGRVKFFEENDQ